MLCNLIDASNVPATSMTTFLSEKTVLCVCEFNDLELENTFCLEGKN